MSTFENLSVGTPVKIMKSYPGVLNAVCIGKTTIARVLKFAYVTEDGRRWNRRTGIASGATPERGVGTSYAPRIEV